MAGGKTESKGQGHMGLRARFRKAPGEGLAIAKAKKHESPRVRKSGAPSSSELFPALLCTTLPNGGHAPRSQGSRDWTVNSLPSYSNHESSTGATLTLQHLCFSCEAACTGTCWCFGLCLHSCTENGGKDTFRIQLPMHKSMRYTSTKTAYGISYS